MGAGRGARCTRLDVLCVRPLDPLLTRSIIVSRGGYPKQLAEADILGARAGDKRLLNLLADQLRLIARPASPYAARRICDTTGPGAWSKWVTDEGITPLALASRWLPRTDRVESQCLCMVDGAYFHVRHAGSWLAEVQSRPHGVDEHWVEKNLVGGTMTYEAAGHEDASDDPVAERTFGAALPPMIDARIAQRVTEGANRETRLALLRETPGCFPQDDFARSRVRADLPERTESNARETVVSILVTSGITQASRQQSPIY